MTGCSAVCLALAVGMLMLLVLSSPSRQLAKDKGQGGQLSYDASWAAGGHQQQQLARPRVAVYTVNMLGKPAPLRTSQVGGCLPTAARPGRPRPPPRSAPPRTWLPTSAQATY